MHMYLSSEILYIVILHNHADGKKTTQTCNRTYLGCVIALYPRAHTHTRAHAHAHTHKHYSVLQEMRKCVCCYY